jgi:hypothetical protein
MRKSWVFVIAFVSLCCLVGTSWAGTVSVSGTHSADQIKQTCDKVDGTFTETGGSYGCSKVCGGGTTLCSVDCKDGKCTGTCPKCGERRLPTLSGDTAVADTLNNSIQRSK